MGHPVLNTTACAGHEAGQGGGQQALDSEGDHELDAAEAGHQAGRGQLQRPRQRGEGDQPRHRQPLRGQTTYYNDLVRKHP